MGSVFPFEERICEESVKSEDFKANMTDGYVISPAKKIPPIIVRMKAIILQSCVSR